MNQYNYNIFTTDEKGKVDVCKYLLLILLYSSISFFLKKEEIKLTINSLKRKSSNRIKILEDLNKLLDNCMFFAIFIFLKNLL